MQLKSLHYCRYHHRRNVHSTAWRILAENVAGDCLCGHLLGQWTNAVVLHLKMKKKLQIANNEDD